MNVDLTGNDYVSIPRIHSNGALDGINVLHAGAAGLIEWTGDGPDAPFLLPELAVDGVRIDIAQAQWRRLDRWIPTFTVTAGDVTVTGTICAPAGYPAGRGFFIRFHAENSGRSPCELEAALLLQWRWTSQVLATARPLPGWNGLSPAAGALLLETDGGRGPALAILGDHDTTCDADSPARAANGELLRARLTRHISLVPNRRAAVTFYIGAGRERDGAAISARVLRRAGADHWLRQARLELSHMLRAASDHRWAALLNRNLLFNRYFAVGRAIDDDRLYLLRSRITACTAPAVFNEREALLWTIPALIIADPGIAREALFRIFELFSERSGEFLRYVDGGALDPGFSLDQFLLYAWCAAYYAEATGDDTVFDDPLLRQILLETDVAAFMRLHPQQILASTELLPSGDVSDYPYTTTANVLLWVFCNTLARLPELENHDAKPKFDGAAGEIAAAVWQHCVTDVGGNIVLASSTNLEGDAAVYDDPALSLALLPFFGFCPADDPVWSATIEFLRSRRYPLWRDGAVGGIAARADTQHPQLAALCADLLGPHGRDALDRLLRIEFPGGVAALSYDAATGAGIEPWHASLAGFLAWTLVRAAEPLDQGGTGRRPKLHR
ncbi:MAG TPA: glycoside hydrolase family 125 protein [Longimicrobiales bacterium]|nr:glycoside hydrolase family 125 protein [Longimicrobiales bacterium]